MDITIKNGYTSFKGWQEVVNVTNPMSRRLNRYMASSAEQSHKNIKEIIPSLKGFVNTVILKTGSKSSAAGWDINPHLSDKYVLFLHGMAQNITSEQKLYEAIINKKTGVFALEYKGYGQNNKARLHENSLYKDVEAAYKYLTGKKGIQPGNITVMGHSMGGALASRFTANHPEINSLVLISPITSAYGIGGKFITNRSIGIGVSQKAYDFIKKIDIFNLLISLRFNSMARAKKIKVPTYIVQTRNDCVTPYANARLFGNKIHKNGYLKDFITLSEGGHNIDGRKVNVISQIMDKINANI